MDSARHFCGWPLPSFCHSFPPRLLLDTCQRWTLTFRNIGSLFYLISLFFAYTFLKKPPLSLKGQAFLLIIFRSFSCEKEQEGIHAAVHFHVLNLISGSHSCFLCQAQFTVFPAARGRGPSRRRLILLAYSRLGEINACVTSGTCHPFPWLNDRRLHCSKWS